MTIKPGTAGLTRRGLLRGLGATAALSMTGARVSIAESGSDSTVYDCLVLGAGVAGAVAARDLARAGRSVLLLEGLDRVGGRMHTNRDFVRHPDYRAQASRFPLELGAEYIHVGNKKRYRAFLDEIDGLGFSRDKLSKIQRARVAFPDWKRNPKKMIVSLLRNTNLIPTVTLLGGINDFDPADGQDLPAGAYVGLRQERGKYKGKGITMARHSISAHTPGVLFDPRFDTVRRSDGSTCELPASADEISIGGLRVDRVPHQLVYETAEYKLMRDGEFCGYDSLPATLVDQFLDPGADGRPGRLLLGHRVVSVRRDGGEVVVQAVNASGERRELRARSALCTFSAGMLAAHGGEIFGGLWTPSKRQALSSIKMGAITKFSLEFKKSYWGRKAKTAILVNPAGCARTFFSPYPRKQGPFILTALLMGRDYELLRGEDDETAIQYLLDDLSAVLNRKKVRRWRPEDVLVGRGSGATFEPNYSRQDWAQDEFALGGNSFIRHDPAVGFAELGGLRESLRDPTETLPVFWAGEATATAYDSRYQPLSVHGAYISGVGAASDVRAFLETSGEEFRASFQREGFGKATIQQTLPVPTLKLTPRERSQLEAWAARNAEGDLEAAARELTRRGLFAYEYTGKKLKAKPRADAEPVGEVKLARDELELIEEYAQELFDGDVNLTARAFFLRGLATGG